MKGKSVCLRQRFHLLILVCVSPFPPAFPLAFLDRLPINESLALELYNRVPSNNHPPDIPLLPPRKHLLGGVKDYVQEGIVAAQDPTDGTGTV